MADDDTHERSKREMADIRADPNAQHNLPLQLRGTAPTEVIPNIGLRMRGTGNLANDAPNDDAPLDDAPPVEAHTKGGRVGYAKGGVVGDTKPRYKGVIHKGG